MINRVVLVGRLTREPELRYTPNGIAVVTFTLAVNRARTDKDGNRAADYINCIAWRKTAENIANYVKKGHQMGLDGQITTRNYEGKDGKRVYVTEVLVESVEFLEPRKDARNAMPEENDAPPVKSNDQKPANQPSGPFARETKPIDISDDDLPF
ncbi:single-stranded DNA-binding protein [Listeria cossartiae subsp. cayugensis]|uniref:Single-stranded DNA-binding protein n=1 Tax=Listeria cossartiae subsp. cayugensis TaxID=2713505 RepID=A0ABU2ITK6_9LIST|nr:single-stranded DNA-binding protein [Listeria cossartiae]MDT0067310.1 single-stranded DNA-binding protein [Listeria cossartiae subsp. cayugensis]MDT0081157.1 single-stranded DNA-binding protein [Listeria cossartiae subsp. cayugensis]MDT0083993.1 single-stranded DNA-binding protein [Listeria cossartiae subsp. cayugensis]MDT0089539.1 single-stranded DNA-binding protein [Listeria cossartiae subsp. cayugensis]MDT0100609.1 single-stranded DNA-binding protein [Listeria cossartiae subsp. cayugensi